MIPAGLLAAVVKPYAKPVPAFGPGSVEYTRRQAEELELLSADTVSSADSTVSSASRASASASLKSYAGAEAYY